VAQYQRLQYLIITRPPNYRNDFPNDNVFCPVRWHRCICGAFMAAGTFFGSFFVQAKKEYTNTKKQKTHYQPPITKFIHTIHPRFSTIHPPS
jgi:hypothetical protein